MDSNTYLAIWYRPEFHQLINWNGVQWEHVVGGNWLPRLVYGE